MTPTQIAELREAVAALGPLSVDERVGCALLVRGPILDGCADNYGAQIIATADGCRDKKGCWISRPGTTEGLRRIASVVNALPALLDALDTLKAKLAEMEGVVRMGNQRESWARSDLAQARARLEKAEEQLTTMAAERDKNFEGRPLIDRVYVMLGREAGKTALSEDAADVAKRLIYERDALKAKLVEAEERLRASPGAVLTPEQVAMMGERFHALYRSWARLPGSSPSYVKIGEPALEALALLAKATGERDALKVRLAEVEKLAAKWERARQIAWENEGKVLALQERLAAVEGFDGTAEHINRLPARLRRFVHDLETRCDPAGDVAVIFAQRENIAGLEAKLAAAYAAAAASAARAEALARPQTCTCSFAWPASAQAPGDKLGMDGHFVGCPAGGGL